MRAFEALLQGAQRKRELRADVDIADVLDLAVGCVTTRRWAWQRNAGDRLVAVVVDGLGA